MLNQIFGKFIRISKESSKIKLANLYYTAISHHEKSKKNKNQFKLKFNYLGNPENSNTE